MNYSGYEKITANIETILAPFKPNHNEGYMGQVWDRIALLGIDVFSGDQFTIHDLMCCASMVKDPQVRERMRVRLHLMLNDGLNWHVREVGENNLTAEEIASAGAA